MPVFACLLFEGSQRLRLQQSMRSSLSSLWTCGIVQHLYRSVIDPHIGPKTMLLRAALCKKAKAHSAVSAEYLFREVPYRLHFVTARVQVNVRYLAWVVLMPRPELCTLHRIDVMASGPVHLIVNEAHQWHVSAFIRATPCVSCMSRLKSSRLHSSRTMTSTCGCGLRRCTGVVYLR